MKLNSRCETLAGVMQSRDAQKTASQGAAIVERVIHEAGDREELLDDKVPGCANLRVRDDVSGRSFQACLGPHKSSHKYTGQLIASILKRLTG